MWDLSYLTGFHPWSGEVLNTGPASEGDASEGEGLNTGPPGKSLVFNF